MLNICKQIADDDDSCDAIAAVACYFCPVEAEEREDIVCRNGKGDFGYNGSGANAAYRNGGVA